MSADETPPTTQFSDADVETMARAVYGLYHLISDRSADKAASGAEAVWASASDLERDSCRAQVRDIPRKLARVHRRIVRSAGGMLASDVAPFSAEEVELLARDEHERWMAHERESGSAGAGGSGPTAHPCMVPFDQLSDEDQEKDRAAVRNIPQLLALTGMGLDREHAGS